MVMHFILGFLHKEEIKTILNKQESLKTNSLTDSRKEYVGLCNEQIIVTINSMTSLTELFLMAFLNLGQWGNNKDLF